MIMQKRMRLRQFIGFADGIQRDRAHLTDAVDAAHRPDMMDPRIPTLYSDELRPGDRIETLDADGRPRATVVSSYPKALGERLRPGWTRVVVTDELTGARSYLPFAPNTLVPRAAA